MEEYRGFEYHFGNQRMYEKYCCIDSIGKAHWRNRDGAFDCRTSEEKQCIFLYTVSGQGRMVIGRQHYPIKEGQAFLIEKPGPYLYETAPECDHWDVYYITLNLASLDMWKDLADQYGRVVNIPKDSSAMKYWENLYRLAVDGKINDFYFCSGYAYTFMMCLNETLQKEISEGNHNDAVLNCVNYIHTHYREEITLPFLTGMCGVSAAQLSKKFKIAYHMSPIQYLIRYRIDMACALLLRSNEKVEDIAVKVGFHDPNYFTRMFKQLMGMTPREYRSAGNASMEENALNQQIALMQKPDKK